MHWINLEDEQPAEDEVVEWGNHELIGEWPDSLDTITPVATAPIKYKPYHVDYWRRID